MLAKLNKNLYYYLFRRRICKHKKQNSSKEERCRLQCRCRFDVSIYISFICFIKQNFKKIPSILILVKMFLVIIGSKEYFPEAELKKRTISLGFLGIILRVLRLEVSAYNVCIAN
jgi:hypothetical protein